MLRFGGSGSGSVQELSTRTRQIKPHEPEMLAQQSFRTVKETDTMIVVKVRWLRFKDSMA